MSNNKLWLLFPVYEEIQDKPHYIVGCELRSADEMNCELQRLSNIFEALKSEHAEVHYDSHNLRGWLFPLRTLQDCYPNMETRILHLLTRNASDWRRGRRQDDASAYKYFDADISDCTLCELTERQIADNERGHHAIVNAGGIRTTRKTITTSRNGLGTDTHVLQPSVNALFGWLADHRVPTRIYNWNPKHGESGKGAHPGNKGEKVSVLHCSREHAAELLKRAVGEAAGSGPLYFFDSERNMYMEFKRESKESNTFHSYHLDPEDEPRALRFKKLINLILTEQC